MEVIKADQANLRRILDENTGSFDDYGFTVKLVATGGPALEAQIQSIASGMHLYFDGRDDEFPEFEGFEVSDCVQYLRDKIAARQLINKAVEAGDSGLGNIIHQAARGLHGYFQCDVNDLKYKNVSLCDCEQYLRSKIKSSRLVG